MNTDENKTEETYAYSLDEEMYHGGYGSPEEAAHECFECDDDAETCHVGRCVTPDPVDYLDAEILIDNIQCQDDFAGEWAENWPGEAKEQRDELTAEFKKVFAAWLDRHNLRPRFFNVVDVQTITRESLEDARKEQS